MKKTIITLTALAAILAAFAGLLIPVSRVRFALNESGTARRYDRVEEYIQESDTLYLADIISRSGNNVLNTKSTVNVTFRGTNEELEFVKRSADFTYSDEFFSDSAYTYNNDLAAMSFGLCLSAATSYDENCDSYVKDAFTQMDFTDIQTYKYDVTLNDASSSTAHAIAHKELGDGTSVIAVAVRGLCYGCEWADNMNLGDGAYHDGFYNAALDLTGHLSEYEESNRDELGENVKYWIVGFSRAAAVANLVAARLDETADAENVYAYTFATPKAVNTKKVQGVSDEKYANIFNICFEADIVPSAVMSHWGFDRYGTTVYLSSSMSDGEISALNNAYVGITGEAFDFSVFNGLKQKVNTLTTAVASAFESQDVYAEKYQAAAVDLINFYEVEADGDTVFEKYRSVYAERRYIRTAGKRLCADETLMPLLNQLDNPTEGYRMLCVVFARGKANGVSYNEMRTLLLKLVIPAALYRSSLPYIVQAHRAEIYLTFLRGTNR